MGGLLGFLLVMFLIFGPLWLVFTLVFAAVKAVFKLTFWAIEAVIVILALVLGGGLFAILGIVFIANIVALPCMLIFSRK